VDLGNGTDLARRRDDFLQVIVARHEDAVLGAGFTQDAGEAARVDPLDARNALRLEVVGDGGDAAVGTVVGRVGAYAPDDQSRGLDARRLHVFQVDAVVADLGIGQGDQLAGVGGIGEDFLVTGE